MTLEDLLIEPTPRSYCRFKKEYDDLDERDRELLRTAFANLEISTSFIFRVLSVNGFKSSESTIRTHRRGNCRTCGTIA
jgi:hypothetical protein